jgi:hypothetical protein
MPHGRKADETSTPLRFVSPLIGMKADRQLLLIA